MKKLIKKFQNPAGVIQRNPAYTSMAPIVSEESTKLPALETFIEPTPLQVSMTDPKTKQVKTRFVKNTELDAFYPFRKGQDFISKWYQDSASRQLYNQHVQEYLADEKERYVQEDLKDNETYKDIVTKKIPNIEASIRGAEEGLKRKYPNGEWKNVPYVVEQFDMLNTYQNTKNQMEQEAREVYDSDPYFDAKTLNQTNQVLDSKIDNLKVTPFGYYNDGDSTYVYHKGQNPEQYANTQKLHEQAYASNIAKKKRALQTGQPYTVLLGYNSHNPDDQTANMSTYLNVDEAESNIGHESMHQMDLKAAAHAASKLLRERYGVEVDGDEALSWLMTDRVSNDMKPGKRDWSTEEVQGVWEKTKDNTKGLLFELQKVFENKYKNATPQIQERNKNLFIEASKDLYNLISKNDNSNNNINPLLLNDDISYAKQGKKLIQKQTIGKFQNPAGPLRAKWDKVNEYASPVAKAASSFIPLVGTYQDYKTFKENPTWGNAGWLALSALGDALTLTGVGAGAGTAIKAGRAARVANAAYDTVNAVRRTGDALDTMADAGKAVDAVQKVKTSYDLTNSYINT